MCTRAAPSARSVIGCGSAGSRLIRSTTTMPRCARRRRLWSSSNRAAAPPDRASGGGRLRGCDCVADMALRRFVEEWDDVLLHPWRAHFRRYLNENLDGVGADHEDGIVFRRLDDLEASK